MPPSLKVAMENINIAKEIVLNFLKQTYLGKKKNFKTLQPFVMQ